MNGIKQEPDIKMEDALTPSGSGYMDDDFYEDTGELQLPTKGVEKDIWLTRIPDWLYDKISKWDELVEGNDDDQIQIGEVIAFPDQMEKSGINKTQPMRLFFDDRWRQKSDLPTAFELEPQRTKGEVLNNTYIFTEKDLPGYKPSNVGQNKYGPSGGFGAVQDPKARIQKRGRYKKAIPKQTALIGSATRQYLAKPLNTQDFISFEAARHRQAVQGANAKTNIIETNSFNEFNEMDKTQSKFNSFIRPLHKGKSQINKAARIPRNELVDQLHMLFDEYMYWPMKSLKQRTRQPEAYLKEVLGDIAHLVKSGPFASCWARQSVYNTNPNASMKEEVPPDTGAPDSGDDEDEMEDVV